MLFTNLDHINTAAELKDILAKNENVMVTCGRMGPMCTPVYQVMEDIRDKYSHVAFFDMEFDNPEASIIRNLPECRTFRGLPFVVYYKNGEVVEATSSIQDEEQITTILDRQFG
ncbi:MAG: thioredoxin family protein [Bacillota bacterium]